MFERNSNSVEDTISAPYIKKNTEKEINYSYGKEKEQENIPKELTEEINTLRIENAELQANILRFNQALDDHRREIRRLKSQIEEMTQPPFFVATVTECFENDVLIKMHGNNQEVLSHVIPELRGKLEPGMRITVNGAYVVMDILTQSTDVRAQVMELIAAPDVTYDMIGGLDDVIQEVIETVELPLTHPELFEEIGIEPPSGVILYGAPGTGKTLIAKAVASQAKATFIRMSGSDLVQKFVGEGARLVKDIFEMARSKSPAILFIDEIDAVGGMRTFDGTSGSAEVNRTMIQLLAEMDGFDTSGDVKVMAATNRIDLLDPALLRPGRFDRAIEVPMPDEKARLEILKIHTKKMNLGEDVSLKEIAKKTKGFSGADLSALCKEAGMFVLRRKETKIKMEDMIKASEKVKKEATKTNAPYSMFV
ncbi:MAG: proteasome-activating nucleotidase [Methanosarcinaceae archaeon]|nr:proteasome-activating nucleotidase [Methanosarcinaceae archaeon]